MHVSERLRPNRYVYIGAAIVLLTFGGMGGWAMSARIDSAVIASGAVAIDGNRRVVQHFEGGIVEEIHVREADTVAAGDVLVTMNDVSARSDVEIAMQRLSEVRAAEARLVTERILGEEIAFPEDLATSEDPRIVAVLEAQVALFEDRKSILSSQTDILESRVSALREQIDGLNTQKDSLRARVEIVTELTERFRLGQERGVVVANALAEREDELIQIESELAAISNQVTATRISMGEAELQILQLGQEFRERATNELDASRSEMAELRERVKVARAVLDRTRITAVSDGRVQNIQVAARGTVVGAGQPLMEIVPADEPLIVNARVAPTDIDNIAPGLTTELRFTSFASKLTPIVLGEVSTVSTNSITPDNPNEPPYYLARILVDDVAVPETMKGRILPGMPVDIVISTGERTVMNYLVSPLTDALRTSLREE